MGPIVRDRDWDPCEIANTSRAQNSRSLYTVCHIVGIIIPRQRQEIAGVEHGQSLTFVRVLVDLGITNALSIDVWTRLIGSRIVPSGWPEIGSLGGVVITDGICQVEPRRSATWTHIVLFGAGFALAMTVKGPATSSNMCLS